MEEHDELGDEASLELVVGATYASASAGVEAVQDHALASGKSVRVGQRSGVHRVIECTAHGCTMFVRLYRKQVKKVKNGSWYISSMQLDHKNCTATAKPNQRQIATLPTFLTAVQANPLVSATALVDQVQRRDGIALAQNKRTVYRAKGRIAQSADAEATKAYSKLPAFLRLFAQLNPGSCCTVVNDSMGKFSRAIVAHKAALDAGGACQRVLGVDCSHSKCPSFSGVQIALVGRDGDFRNIVLAVALAPAEDHESYTWFFTELKKVGAEFTDVPIFCDRHPSLLAVAATMGLDLRYCTQHILRNVRTKFSRFGPRHSNLIWRVQSAATVEEYDKALAALSQEVGADVGTYVKLIPPIRWCLHANVGRVALYGWRTSNFVESVFGTQMVQGLRILAPYPFIEAVCRSMVDAAYGRSQAASKWAHENLTVTPGARKLYDKQSSCIGKYSVQHASEEVAYVTDTSANPVLRRRVNKVAFTCTCPFMDQYGIPCRHLIAALNSCNMMEIVDRAFSPCYLVATYGQAFRNKAVLLPLEAEVDEEAKSTGGNVCHPPNITRQPGRPKIKRIRSNGEAEGMASYRCSKCNMCGHNKRRCTMS